MILPYLDGLSSHDDKLVSSLAEKASEFVTQHLFNLVGLLDHDTHAYRIDRGLDFALFFLVATNSNRVENKFLTRPDFDFGLVVPFHRL